MSKELYATLVGRNMNGPICRIVSWAGCGDNRRTYVHGVCHAGISAAVGREIRIVMNSADAIGLAVELLKAIPMSEWVNHPIDTGWIVKVGKMLETQLKEVGHA